MIVAKRTRKANYPKIGVTHQKEEEPVYEFRAKVGEVFKMNSELQDDAVPVGVY